MNLFDVMNQMERATSKDAVLRWIQDYGDRCDSILSYAKFQFRDDIDVVQAALEFDVRSIQYASDSLKSKLALEVVKKKGDVLRYLGRDSQSNRNVVLEAVRQDGMAIQYADPELWQDSEIIEEAILQNSDVLDWLDQV